MASSRILIAEKIERLLSGGNPSQAIGVKREELYAAIADCLNALLKLDHLQVTMPNGETVPDGAAMTTYEEVVVEPWKNVSRVRLPAMPIRLPQNMGLWAIRPNALTTEQTGLDSQFIPIPLGFSVLLKGQPMISGLLGQVGYEQKGIYAAFNKDITLPNEEVKVDIDLVVLDMSQYDDYEILPISADMEATCVQTVYKLYASEPAQVNIADPISDKTKDYAK